MEERHRTEITIETDRMFVIRKRKNTAQAWCLDCPQPCKMVPPEEVPDAAGLSSREIYRAVETGKLHFIETPEGLVLICLNSLSLLGSTPVSITVEANGFPGVPSIAMERGLEIERTEPSPATGSIWNKNGESRSKPWVLTSEAFDQLLGCLGADRESAGQKYENIRRKLMKYFEYRGCFSAEDRTDETINRVARRVSEGRKIWTRDPSSYFYGVARNVLREYWGAPERETLPIEYLSLPAKFSEHPASFDSAQSQWSVELGLEALEQSMRELPPESRELILEYYQGERGDKIRNRQEIAKRLGIPPNALRIRVHRIREKLEHKVKQYLRDR